MYKGFSSICEEYSVSRLVIFVRYRAVMSSLTCRWERFNSRWVFSFLWSDSWWSGSL